MFGIGNMSGKAAASMIKPYIGPILTTTITEIIKAGGGDDRCACLCWTTKRADGTATIMARIYRLNEMDEPGEELATIDVIAAANSLDISKFLGE